MPSSSLDRLIAGSAVGVYLGLILSGLHFVLSGSWFVPVGAAWSAVGWRRCRLTPYRGGFPLAITLAGLVTCLAVGSPLV